MLDLGMDELQESEAHPDLELLPEDVRLVLVAYACSMDQGVMRAEWGSAELRREDRYLIWHHHEPLPLDGRLTTALQVRSPCGAVRRNGARWSLYDPAATASVRLRLPPLMSAGDVSPTIYALMDNSHAPAGALELSVP
ncbi:hypothetical protein GCM10010271_36560 [Streptomyces kurssanovii]|nr:hypothetical protein GCM10010271_36560 [Streptomyces kurssanovii]